MGYFHEIYAYRELLFSLVRRDLRGRYKSSFLGFLWTFVNPLLQLLTYTLVFSVVVKVDVENYGLFLMSTLLSWMYTATALQRAVGIVVQHSNLVKKVYFPVEILPTYINASGLLSYLFSLPVLIIAFWVGGRAPTAMILYLPLVLFVQFLFNQALSLIVSGLNVYVRDTEYILGVFVMVWFYITPVLYPTSFIPEGYEWIFSVNPMMPIIDAYRRVLYEGSTPEFVSLAAVGVLSLLATAGAVPLFRWLRRGFVDHL